MGRGSCRLNGHWMLCVRCFVSQRSMSTRVGAVADLRPLHAHCPPAWTDWSPHLPPATGDRRQGDCTGGEEGRRVWRERDGRREKVRRHCAVKHRRCIVVTTRYISELRPNYQAIGIPLLLIYYPTGQASGLRTREAQLAACVLY